MFNYTRESPSKSTIRPSGLTHMHCPPEYGTQGLLHEDVQILHPPFGFDFPDQDGYVPLADFDNIRTLLESWYRMHPRIEVRDHA
jgi:hypothetical protein